MNEFPEKAQNINNNFYYLRDYVDNVLNTKT